MRELNTIQEPGWVFKFLTAPWLWAAGATWLFYQQLPHLPYGRELALRYFCEHPLERVLAGLFFVGLTIICIKAVLLIFERRAFRRVPDFGITDSSEPLETNVSRFQNRLTSASDELQNTWWGRRLDHLLAFLKGQKTTQGLSEHLNYLTESAIDRLHASHALLQTVIWSIPILGFLGTVMGITLAIANVTPDQLETSLDEVTNGLAVAFDTTALALSLSLVLGFASLFVKRGEENLLSEIDERCRLEVHRCFPASTEQGNPLLEAERAASQSLLEQTTQLIQAQTAAWGESLGQLREQWAGTLQSQQRQLVDALATGTDETLANHARQLADYRQQFLEAQETVAGGLIREIQQLQSSREESERRLQSTVQNLGELWEASVNRSFDHQQQRFGELIADFSDRIENWQAQTAAWQADLQQVTAALVQQSEVLLNHGGQLEKIVDQEESLIKLQTRLDRNLETVRTAETFEQTLHNLTAAVHLLTARNRGRDAA